MKIDKGAILWWLLIWTFVILIKSISWPFFEITFKNHFDYTILNIVLFFLAIGSLVLWIYFLRNEIVLPYVIKNFYKVLWLGLLLPFLLLLLSHLISYGIHKYDDKFTYYTNQDIYNKIVGYLKKEDFNWEINCFKNIWKEQCKYVIDNKKKLSTYMDEMEIRFIEKEKDNVLFFLDDLFGALNYFYVYKQKWFKKKDTVCKQNKKNNNLSIVKQSKLIECYNSNWGLYKFNSY